MRQWASDESARADRERRAETGGRRTGGGGAGAGALALLAPANVANAIQSFSTGQNPNINPKVKNP